MCRVESPTSSGFNVSFLFREMVGRPGKVVCKGGILVFKIGKVTCLLANGVLRVEQVLFRGGTPLYRGDKSLFLP